VKDEPNDVSKAIYVESAFDLSGRTKTTIVESFWLRFRSWVFSDPKNSEELHTSDAQVTPVHLLRQHRESGVPCCYTWYEVQHSTVSSSSGSFLQEVSVAFD
jgi:hypothetical protein